MANHGAGPVCVTWPSSLLGTTSSHGVAIWLWRSVRTATVAAALLAIDAVHEQAPWVPLPYLATLLVLPVIAWRLVRWRTGRGVLRWSSLGLVLTTLGALCPVPWMTAGLADPPGTAWRLDGRLTIDGDVVDPPGSWYWLTVGRPPLVAELVYGWLFHSPAAHDLRDGGMASRPQFNEPAAAAVGLRRAGRAIAFGLTVEASDSALDDLPERLVLTRLNGVPLKSRDHWFNAMQTLANRNTMTTADGDVIWFDGDRLPYTRVDLFDIPLQDVDASVGGPLATVPPGRWFRGLSLGRSHGLMVALLAYMHESGEDLGGGRAIAGTGGIRGDGSVSSIGGLWQKAGAARDAGADALLFPAAQASELASFETEAMLLVPVASLDEAIATLRKGTTTGGR